MLRRLHHTQPESFAFTPENQKWAEAQIAKYPEGRQASAVIPILWRAQEQEGWITRPIIETVAKMLGMADIRVLEVVTFYFMFQMQPVGSVAHFQVCGTLSCLICGAEDLIAVCREKIAPNPHELSADGKFSWEEVECLGACSNAPMAQIGKDYYEDLTAERFAEIIDEFAAGKVPTPGPQNGRYASEPITGLTSLKIPEAERVAENASRELARVLGDTNMRITDGRGTGRPSGGNPDAAPESAPRRAAEEAKPASEPTEPKAPQEAMADAAAPGDGPELLKAAREGHADDLKRIKGVGPKLETLLNQIGVFHFDQIAAWTDNDVAWIDGQLNFKGRVEREGWIEQARKLAAE
ncbi:NADH-quinone oxidoreductase subunit NuoE [Pikeienuella piscinae]|uniref:NADH-quinone oxidoreductase subunit NuoE n=1 Tax=Pikeienuella piscinae TaxID=2748098 RepID=A0A7L5BUA0_9RHOB|nr:NADH-quinone oxidoreductase subunit NuoE [Pikeienuella piscinae]QIE54238.1 NADH-quinone oxidoreductase subunit NuoE [Pikeienuella piscinae]